MSFCKRVFLSVCAFGLGLMFSANAQEESLQSYTMKCFPTPFDGKIVTICLKNEDEDETGEGGVWVLPGTLGDNQSETAPFVFVPLKEGEDENIFDWEEGLINPDFIEEFKFRGKVEPITICI